MISYLKWDSDFFNKKIGSLKDYNSIELPAEFFSEAKTYDLVYISSLKALKSEAVKLVDIKKTYTKPTSSINLSKSNNSPRYFVKGKDSFDELLKLVYVSGHESRFRKRPYFNENDFRRLYRKWIGRSLSSESELVLVKIINNSISGFISCKLDSVGNGTIELIAVHPDYTGRGIGKELIGAIEARLGVEKALKVATQEWNTGACQFYEKYGFRLIKKSFIYHYGPNSI